MLLTGRNRRQFPAPFFGKIFNKGDLFTSDLSFKRSTSELNLMISAE